MLKRVISLCVLVAMLITMVPTFVLAADTDETNVIEEFKDYLVNSKILSDDGYAHIPVHINTYVNGTTDKNSQVIVYIMNHAMERVGTDLDNDIIRDFLNDTEYKNIVVTVDFLNNPKAVSPQIDYSVAQIISDIRDEGAYLNGNTYGQYLIHAVPSGCRIARDIWYFDLLENGAKGTEEAIIASWNSDDFKNTHAKRIPACEGNNYQEGVWFEATSIDQLVRSKANGGGPIDTDLRLDIVYPSNPTSKPPVWMWASASETRAKSTLGTPYKIGFALRGYAVVAYDHEYYPMSRNDHYSYYSGSYGTARTNGVKTHTAAARCVRYYADEFGYDVNRLSVGGHSKSSYSALLGRDNPELLEELDDYTKYGYEKGENYGEQPFLTYKNSDEKIPSNVQVIYTSMGDGAKLYNRLLCDSSVPAVIACGKNDQYGAWDYWDELQAAYMEWDIPNLAVGMTDMGHSLPKDIDPDLNYDRYDAVIDFFDYYLKPQNGSKPTVVYTSPVDGNGTFDGISDVVVKFTAPVDENEVKSKVKVLDENGSELSGIWKKYAADNEYHFVSDEYEHGVTYTISVDDTLKAKTGETFESGIERTFSADIGDFSYSSKDAYIEIGNNANFGNATSIEISKDKKLGYFEFDLSNFIGTKDTGSFSFSVANDAAQKLKVYGIDSAVWNEGTINSSNAPSLSLATYIADVSIAGKGTYTVDVSNFIKTVKGSKVTFILEAQKETGKKGLVQSFDSLTSLTKASVSDNNPVSETAIYKTGGDPQGVNLTSDKDHTTGSGKSVYFKRNDTWDRIKFFNTFGPNELTEDDIGDTYRISFWVNPDSDVTVKAGLMCSSIPDSDATHPQAAYCKYDQNFFGTTVNQNAEAGKWTKVSLDYTITKDIIDGRIQMLTMESSVGASSYYIDDIEVELLATDVSVTSKEGKNLAENQFKPKLSVTTIVPEKVYNQPLVEFNSSSDIKTTSTTDYTVPKWFGSSTQVTYMSEGYARIFGAADQYSGAARAGFAIPTTTVTESNEQYLVSKIQIHPGASSVRYRLVTKDSSGALGSPYLFSVDLGDTSGKFAVIPGVHSDNSTSATGPSSGFVIDDYYKDGWADCVAIIDMNNTDESYKLTVYVNGYKKETNINKGFATSAKSGGIIGISMQNNAKANNDSYIDNTEVYSMKKSNLVPQTMEVDGNQVIFENEVTLSQITNTSDKTLSVIKANGQYLPLSAVKVEKGSLKLTISEDALSFGDNEIDLSEVKDIFGQNIYGENTFTITKEMPVVEVIGEDIKASYDDGKGANTVTNRFFANLVNIEDIAEAGFEISTVIDEVTYAWEIVLDTVYENVIANDTEYVTDAGYILTGAIGDVPNDFEGIFTVKTFVKNFEGVKSYLSE